MIPLHLYAFLPLGFLLGILGLSCAISLWLRFAGDPKEPRIPIRSAEIFYLTPPASRPGRRDGGEVRTMQNARPSGPLSGHSYARVDHAR